VGAAVEATKAEEEVTKVEVTATNGLIRSDS
jgi:hypothetical protein